MEALPVTYEPASQRRHFRITAPAHVRVDGSSYPTLDWSLGGFRIGNCAGGFNLRDHLQVEFALDFQGFHISFPASAEVVWRQGDQLGSRWMHLGQRESGLLRQFASDVMGGRVASIDGVLKGIDRPVTKVELVEKGESHAARNKRSWQRAAVSTLYLAVGLALAGSGLWIAAQMWRTLTFESAVTAVPLEQVVSIDAGEIREMRVVPGSEVRAGQMLIRVDSEVASRNVDVARHELKSAEAELAEAHSLVQQEQNRMAAYRVIGSDQAGMENAKINALIAARDEARTEFERVKKLWEYGVIARQLYDAQEASVKRHEAEVEAAQAEAKIIATSNQSINSGFFFSGNFLVGELQTRIAEEEAARQRVSLAKTAVQDALGHEQKHDYRAPFDGTVLRAFKSAGMTVDRGEALLVLRKRGEPAHIDAFLTQEEAGRIVAGTHAVVFVPALGKRYQAEVVQVDRTSGFLKEIETPKLQQPQWDWRTPQERTAYARLNLLNAAPGDLAALQPGLPARIQIQKKSVWPFARGIATGVQAAGKEDPRLWPPSSPVFGPDGAKALPPAVRERVMEAAAKAERLAPAPVQTIHSAGVADPSSPGFAASRRAFQDADNYLFLALAYRLTGRIEYRDHARAVVRAWAQLNQPTGQPIDETRLEAFLWGLDLLGDKYEPETRAWLERWSAANHIYSFGPKTESNNHKTHHLKIALMLDKLLGRTSEYERDLAAASRHEQVNLGNADGSSLDYRERDAMHYHIFDLEPWMEIALMSGCCGSSVDRAFAFFDRQTRDHPGDIEFANSTAPIDRKRASGGFEYAQARPYETGKAARAIFAYATLPGRSVPPDLWKVAVANPTHSSLFYEARYYLWQAR